jgi:hypothetical protein
VTSDGFVQNEGDVQVSPGGPYLISYRAIIPARGSVTNLTVPVCPSSSHIAFGSIRMEPVFMVLGQSAATAAVLAQDAGMALQDLPYERLRARLLDDRQVLDLPADVLQKRLITGGSLPGLVVDDTRAVLEGVWTHSNSIAKFVGADYLHDGNSEKAGKSARWNLTAPSAGLFEVRMSYSAADNRATNVLVVVDSGSTRIERTVNQRVTPAVDGLFEPIGRFQLAAGDHVELIVDAVNTNGHVIVDAAQLISVTGTAE